MKKQIVEMIKRKTSVSFVELERGVDGFEGEMSFGLPDKNIFYWFNISDDASEALKELLDSDVIKMTPANPLVYFIDGNRYRMPHIAKQVRNYKEPRWIPVVFNLV